jgi:hypothetical protein
MIITRTLEEFQNSMIARREECLEQSWQDYLCECDASVVEFPAGEFPPC